MEIYDIIADPRTGRSLLLVVALFPFVSAMLLPLFGGAARRVALWLALLHLALTAMVVGLGAMVLAERAEQDAVRSLHSDWVRFQPEFVPGDAGGKDGNYYRTKWNLMSLSPAPDPDRPGPNVQFYLGIDGLNIWLLALASFMMLPAILVSWEGVKERPGAFYG